MKKIKNLLIGAALTLGVFVALPAGLAYADAADDICSGASCDRGTGDAQISEIIATVIDVFTFVIGIVAVIMIIVGGFKYITSGGDSNSVNSAKNTILYAVIGLVVVVLAQIIARFTIKKAGG